MKKQIALILAAAVLAPSYANAGILQCHKSACPPTKSSAEPVQQIQKAKPIKKKG
jgi:hypothetical protein